jgi:hypothetical protein
MCQKRLNGPLGPFVNFVPANAASKVPEGKPSKTATLKIALRENEHIRGNSGSAKAPDQRAGLRRNKDIVTPHH